jgi:hypothetical protein
VRGFVARRRRSRACSGPAPITLTTPRDFDISPYFEIVKFNILEDMRFDYRQIRWAE